MAECFLNEATISEDLLAQRVNIQHLCAKVYAALQYFFLRHLYRPYGPMGPMGPLCHTGPISPRAEALCNMGAWSRAKIERTMRLHLNNSGFSK